MKTCPNCFGIGGFGGMIDCGDIVCDKCLGTGKVHDNQYTCHECPDEKTCKYAWDLYNTNGDCLAYK